MLRVATLHPPTCAGTGNVVEDVGGVGRNVEGGGMGGGPGMGATGAAATGAGVGGIAGKLAG